MHVIVSFIASLFQHTQTEYIEFAYKVVILTGLASSIAFIAQYTYYAPWWKDVIGKRIVYETIAIMLILIPSALSLFFDLNRLTSEFIAWYDVSLLGIVSAIIIWGMIVWKRERDTVRGAALGGLDDSNQEKDFNSNKAPEQGKVHSEGKKGREVSTSRSNSSTE